MILKLAKYSDTSIRNDEKPFFCLADKTSQKAEC